MKNNRLIFALLCIVFFTTFIISLGIGSTSVFNHNTLPSVKQHLLSIVWHFRLPRTLTALTCGGLLAVAGLMMQLLLANPLADPYVLGISSSAAFMTLLCVLLGYTEFAFTAGAWLGSLMGIGLIFYLAIYHRFHSHSLILIGIALSTGFSALISCLLLLSNDTTLHSLLFWLSGDLNNAHYPWLGLLLLIVGAYLLQIHGQGLNVFMRGELEAQALGLATSYYKLMLFLLSALFTACVVSYVGCLGFIGLIIPHAARYLVGHDHRRLIAATILLGASLLMLADTCSRSLFAPIQIPVGIMLAAVGVPIFIWMIATCQA